MPGDAGFTVIGCNAVTGCTAVSKACIGVDTYAVTGNQTLVTVNTLVVFANLGLRAGRIAWGDTDTVHAYLEPLALFATVCPGTIAISTAIIRVIFWIDAFAVTDDFSRFTGHTVAFLTNQISRALFTGIHAVI